MRLSLSSPPEADGAGEAPQGGTPPPRQANQDAAAMPPSNDNAESARTTAPAPQQPSIPTAASSRPASNTTIAASSAPALPSSSAAAPSAPAPTTLATGQTGTPQAAEESYISEATLLMIEDAAKNFVKEFYPQLRARKDKLKLPRFDASELFAYFARVGYNRAFGIHDVTEFPAALLSWSSLDDTSIPSLPSFDFRPSSSAATQAPAMSFSDFEQGYEEWMAELRARLTESDGPASSSARAEPLNAPEALAAISAAAETHGSASSATVNASSPKATDVVVNESTQSLATESSSTEKPSESEQESKANEATESDQSRADTTEDSSKNTQQGPQSEKSVDQSSKKSPQPSLKQVDESEADESTNNICHANLPLYLQKLASNQQATSVAEPSGEPSPPSPRQQDPMPPNFGAGFGLPADYDNGDLTIMDVPQHAFEDGVANTPKSTQQNAKMWRPKAMEVVEEATEPTASTINTTTDSLLTSSNGSQEPSDDTQNICHANLDAFLRTQPRPSTENRVEVSPDDATSQSNPIPRQVEENVQVRRSSSEASAKKKSSSKPPQAPTATSSSSGSDVNDSTQDVCHANLDAFLRTQPRPSTESRNEGESSGEPSSSMKSNGSQKTLERGQSSSAQSRSSKRRTTTNGDASEAKSAKTDPTEPFDFMIQEAAMEPFRRTLSPMNADSNGSNEHFSIPEGFYMELDDFEAVEESDVQMRNDSEEEDERMVQKPAKSTPQPPNSPASSSSSSSSSESEDNGDGEVDDAVSEGGHEDSEAYFTAAEGDDEDSDADSNTRKDQSGDVDDESADQVAKKSEDEAKKGVSKPTKPNEASPKHGSSSSSSSSDSDSDDGADGNANAVEPIEVIDISSDDGGQESEGSKAKTITINDSEGVSDDASNRTIEIGDESDVEMVELSDDEAVNESEGRHDVEEVVGTGTDANDQHQPSSSQAHIDSQPRNVQPSPKARTVSRLRQVFEMQQAQKKAQEEEKARIKKRQRKLFEEKRAKLKARRARQYAKGPMRSRLRQLYEDGLKKAQLAQQQNAAVTSSDSSAAAPTTPEAPTSAPDAEEARPTLPANNEEMAIDGSHEVAEINEETSGDTSEAPAPSLPANADQTPTEAPEEVRITGWERPQHNGSSDEGSPDHRLLMMRRKFWMREQDRRERLALKLKKKAEKSPMSSPKMRESLAKLANSLKETMRRKLEAAKAQRTEEGSQTPVPSASMLRQMLPEPEPAASTPSTVTRPTSSETATDQACRATSPDNQHIIGDNGSIQERLPSLYIGSLYPSSDSNSDSDSDEAVPIQPPSRTPSPAPHVSPAASPVLADNETGSVANVPAPESTPEPVLPCRWPRCTTCHGKPVEQPTEETDGEVHGREDGDGNAGPNHIEPMDDGDFNDDPLLDQPMASPGSNQPPVNPDDDQMEVDPRAVHPRLDH